MLEEQAIFQRWHRDQTPVLKDLFLVILSVLSLVDHKDPAFPRYVCAFVQATLHPRIAPPGSRTRRLPFHLLTYLLTCLSHSLTHSLTHSQFRISDGDAPPSDNVVARPLRKTDAAILGGMATAVLAQNYRARVGGGAGAETDIHLVTYQVALYDTHGLMTSLQRLAQRAETTTSAGLASLASNVCLELLRGQDGWVASKSSSSRFRDMASAEKEFNEMSVRERKKWAYENSLEDRAALAAYTGPGSVRQSTGKNLMVLTLMVACRHIGNKIMPKKQGSVEALETSLEKFAAALLEKGGRNVVAVDVSWTPDDPKDILSRIELHQKWSDLIDF